MYIADTTANLCKLIPQALVIIDIASQKIIYHNDKAKEAFHITIDQSIQVIATFMNHTVSFEDVYSATYAELKKQGKSILRHINIQTVSNSTVYYDVHISYTDNTKSSVFIMFALSKHELDRMVQQNIYYDNISEATYSYPFYLDVKARRMQLFNPELEEFNLAMSLENFPVPVLESGVLCEDDIDIYLATIDRMYKGLPPEGSFRCYDPKGELLRYTLNYVVNRDISGNPIEVTGDFIIQSETTIETEEASLDLSASSPPAKVILAHQIKAHFFFNTLNTISALCKQDAAKADSAIRSFATYMRSYMHLINETENIAFEQELALIKSTLEIEKLRFPECFIYEFDIQVSNFDIPPLTLQPLVENALLHGLRRTGHHGALQITTRLVGETIEISVCDNGLGFDTTILQKAKSIGIQNLTRRLDLMVGGTVSIKSEVGRGTVATIEIPLL